MVPQNSLNFSIVNTVISTPENCLRIDLTSPLPFMFPKKFIMIVDGPIMGSDTMNRCDGMVILVEYGSPNRFPSSMTDQSDSSITDTLNRFLIFRGFHQVTGKKRNFQNFSNSTLIGNENPCGIPASSFVISKQLREHTPENLQLFPSSTLLSKNDSALTAHITPLSFLDVHVYTRHSQACSQARIFSLF